MPLLRSRQAVRRAERRLLARVYTVMAILTLLVGVSIAAYYLVR